MKRFPGDYSGLTVMQADLLSYIREQQAEDYTPTFIEMAGAVGLSSKSGVHRLLGALEERGYIERMPNRARAVRALLLPRDFGSSPLRYCSIREIFDELKLRGVILEASRL